MLERPSFARAHTLTSRLSLITRLTAAFVTVAVVAVLVLATLTLFSSRHAGGLFAEERQQERADVIAETLSLQYRLSGSWSSVDIHPATMLALQAGAGLEVRDLNNRVINLRNSMPVEALPKNETGDKRQATITVNGRRVGTAVVRFTNGELVQAERHVRAALFSSLLVGIAIASLVALVIGVGLARRIVAPVVQVTDAARRFGRGDRSARAASLHAPGELGELANTFDEMADRLDATDLARRNLSADVAHELRTPLTLLQGGIEELIDGTAPPDLAHMVELHDDVLRLKRLVDDLSLLADADAATAVPRVVIETFDLAEIVQNVCTRLNSFVLSHEHELTLDVQSAKVAGDSNRTSQVIENVLGNAIKFTPSGGHINVSVRQQGNTGGGVVEIGDDGPGVSIEERGRVFERFYRSRATSRTAGSGIGLAVAQQLITAQHGTIELVDRPTGQAGTMVRLTLPKG